LVPRGEARSSQIWQLYKNNRDHFVTVHSLVFFFFGRYLFFWLTAFRLYLLNLLFNLFVFSIFSMSEIGPLGADHLQWLDFNSFKACFERIVCHNLLLISLEVKL
jgi:hypothetical protein